jgi:hypothetical protein
MNTDWAVSDGVFTGDVMLIYIFTLSSLQHCFWSWDNAVGIATDYGLED